VVESGTRRGTFELSPGPAFARPAEFTAVAEAISRIVDLADAFEVVGIWLTEYRRPISERIRALPGSLLAAHGVA
jgi:hypothetical protein